MLPPNSYYERPIPERHRLIFYLGHLEAFDRNLLSPALGLGLEDSPFDKLFAFGIDPVGGGLPNDQPSEWPEIAQVERYNRQVRTRLDERLRDPSVTRALAASPEIGTLLNVAIEHRLMHAETLAYLLHNLAIEKKLPQAGPAVDERPAPDAKMVTIPSGIATLGQPRDSLAFGWDNEFGMQRVLVPSFSISVYPVTNAEYLKFVQAGGYQSGKYWRTEDWDWVRKAEAGASTFLEARERIAGGRREDEVGISRDVRLDSLAAIVAGVCEPRGSIGIREMGGKKTSDRRTVAARGVRHAGRTRAGVSVGRRAAGILARKFQSGPLGPDGRG